MESIYNELATVFLPISEVCDGTVSLPESIMMTKIPEKMQEMLNFLHKKFFNLIDQMHLFYMNINRPGVAGDALQTLSSFIHSLIK